MSTALRENERLKLAGTAQVPILLTARVNPYSKETRGEFAARGRRGVAEGSARGRRGVGEGSAGVGEGRD